MFKGKKNNELTKKSICRKMLCGFVIRKYMDASKLIMGNDIFTVKFVTFVEWRYDWTLLSIYHEHKMYRCIYMYTNETEIQTEK